jgi:hypothetical protein
MNDKPIESPYVDFHCAMTLFFTDIHPIIKDAPMTANDKRATALQIIEGIKEQAREGQALNGMIRVREWLIEQGLKEPI